MRSRRKKTPSVLMFCKSVTCFCLLFVCFNMLKLTLLLKEVINNQSPIQSKQKYSKYTTCGRYNLDPRQLLTNSKKSKLKKLYTIAVMLSFKGFIVPVLKHLLDISSLKWSLKTNEKDRQIRIKNWFFPQHHISRNRTARTYFKIYDSGYMK